MPGLYYIDETILNEWMAQSKTPEGAEAFLNKYIYDVEDFDEYLELVGGIKKLKRLKEVELLRTTKRGGIVE